jgi:hypothetical protein
MSLAAVVAPRGVRQRPSAGILSRPSRWLGAVARYWTIGQTTLPVGGPFSQLGLALADPFRPSQWHTADSRVIVSSRPRPRTTFIPQERVLLENRCVSQHFASKQWPERSATTAWHGSERRRSARGGLHGEPHRVQLVTLILGTYAEMPGLSLQLDQAARLFGLREATCQVVLGDLVREGRLRRCSDSQYRAADSV